MKTESYDAAAETSFAKDTMTTPNDGSAKDDGRKKPNEEALRREARLKQALRENLMRRKAKARATKSQSGSEDES